MRGEPNIPCRRLPSRRRSSSSASARALRAGRDDVELCRAWTGCRLRSSWPPPERSVLSPGQLLERLYAPADLLKGGRDDAPSASRRCGRRSTGATTCSTTDEQRLFARLAVFPAAARSRRRRQICHGRRSTLCTRSSTRACSATGRPLRMLETIREYAASVSRPAGRRLSSAGPMPSVPSRSLKLRSRSWRKAETKRPFLTRASTPTTTTCGRCSKWARDSRAE